MCDSEKQAKSWKFLIITLGIFATSLVSNLSVVILDITKIPLSYEVAQIVTVTLYYTNGVVNPVIYFAAHPRAREYMRGVQLFGRERRREGDGPVELTALRTTPVEADNVCMPNMNATC